MSESKPDKRVIVCNYAEGISSVSKGSLCYVIDPGRGMGSERICIYARARDGRIIEKWEAIKRLENFRVKTLPPESPLYARMEFVRDFNSEEYCAELIAAAARFKKDA